jgi:hypothetical protein
LQVALGQVHFTQPVLGIAGVLAVGVLRRKALKAWLALSKSLALIRSKAAS